jgi:hypothetical protein
MEVLILMVASRSTMCRPKTIDIYRFPEIRVPPIHSKLGHCSIATHGFGVPLLMGTSTSVKKK